MVIYMTPSYLSSPMTGLKDLNTYQQQQINTYGWTSIKAKKITKKERKKKVKQA